MNHLDREILLLLNGLIGRSRILFEAALLLCGSLPLVASVMTWMALWWSREAVRHPTGLLVGTVPEGSSSASCAGRRCCVALAAGASVAVMATRILAAGMEGTRPLAREDLLVPMDTAAWRDLVQVMTGFGAFPSDHAALFFAMALGLFAWGRRLGMMGLAAAVLLCTARVAVGFHYPFDMVAGGLLGGGSAWFFMRMVRHSPGFFDTVVDLFTRYPAIFYPCLFLVCL
ncbi:MAG: phosphatase PAP2 family protein, partial [Acidobacteriota bacterium]